jgi:CRISPR/Cas system-associated exonuclease Cas4 (RecB family)
MEPIGAIARRILANTEKRGRRAEMTNGMLTQFRDEPHVSHSQLSTYMMCSLKYQFQYLLRQPWEFVPAALAFGSAIHGAVTTYYRALKARGEKPPLEEVQQTFQESWRKETSTRPVRFKDKDSAESLLALGRRMLAVFYERQAQAPGEVLAVEEPFSVPIIDPETGETLDLNLVGSFDLVERDAKEAITVVDLKTAAKKYSEANVDNALQMSIYGYAVTMTGMSEGEDVLLRYDVLTKTKEPDLARYYTVRDHPDHRRLFRVIQAVLRGIREEVFYPNPGYYCQDCPFFQACQGWQER